jgi:isoleucyl-tRNA synthetase
VTVALELGIDDELDLERRVYELIRRVNTMRKEAGLDLTDRIDLVVPAADAELLEHADWIKSETLAVSLDASGSELTLVRAG